MLRCTQTQTCTLAVHFHGHCGKAGTLVLILAERMCTYRLSTKSVLLPTNTMMTSLPLSVLTSSIHRAVFRKDWRSAQMGSSSTSTCAKAVQADSTDQTKHTRDIVYHNRNRGVPNIAGYQASEALLPSCVPAKCSNRVLCSGYQQQMQHWSG